MTNPKPSRVKGVRCWGVYNLDNGSLFAAFPTKFDAEVSIYNFMREDFKIIQVLITPIKPRRKI